MSADKRLIEDYLPIEAVGKESSREKNVHNSYVTLIHQWWARRPLVAARAAVYSSLIDAEFFQPAGGPENKKESLGRANAARFVTALCTFPGTPTAITEAQTHLLKAHAKRLSKELGKTVLADDIADGKAPRPKVLDMFSGGGAIPLEAARLGCDSYALDLNPVAHIIELCTLVYPEKHRKPDPLRVGSSKSGTWAGLASEVRHWGGKVLSATRKEAGDLYPAVPDPPYGPPRGRFRHVVDR